MENQTNSQSQSQHTCDHAKRGTCAGEIAIRIYNGTATVRCGRHHYEALVREGRAAPSQLRKMRQALNIY